MKHILAILFAFVTVAVGAQTLEEALSYGLPVVVVNTVNGEEPTAEIVEPPQGCLGKSIINATKVPGRVRIFKPGDAGNPVYDSGDYVEDESGMTFKIRGNTSANAAKKPFKIKLQKKADLLMRGDKKYYDKEWALIRPSGTSKHPCPIVTMIGNKMTEILHVTDWIPAGQYVNLIVNDNYRGFYFLTENVKRNEKCRIDVDETTGYISEIDPYWWNEDIYVGSTSLERYKYYRMTFKYPDSDDITQEQLTCFSDYLGAFDNSITTGIYPLYIDVESCARWLLAHQLLGSKDGAGSNVFLLWRNNQSKFEMGPLWDYDSLFGIQGTFTPVMSAHYFKGMLQESPNKMLAREMVRIWESEKEHIMTEISSFYESMVGTDFAHHIDLSTQANIKRWHGNSLDDMGTTIEKLRQWFATRYEDLNNLLPTLNTQDGDIQWTEVPDGTFVLNGTERPVAGDTLRITSSMDNISELTFKWTRGNALGAFNDAEVISNTPEYVIQEGDKEHWLCVMISDNAGETIFTKKVWISGLPVLYIDTDDGNPITSKTNYVAASLRIQGNDEYEQQYLGTTEIRGRGTTSWSQYPQKPYKLRLDKKTNLFGFGKCKHWVLIPNFNDKSCLRNYIASELARQLGVLGMKMTWVDVVLNGEVKGCYMLSQHVRVDKNSVDIFDWEEEAESIADNLYADIKDVDGLVETDMELLEGTMKSNLSWVTDGIVNFKGKTYQLADYALYENYDIQQGYLFEATAKQDGQTQFTTPGNVHFEVSAPEYLSTNHEIFAYVTGYWNDFEAEYSRVPTLEGKNFSKYADMQSMIGVWLVNEIMGQGDPTNSRYSYIGSDGKLHFGPVWDFDHGGGSWSTIRDVNFFYTLIHNLKYTYYKKWFPDPVLCQMAFDAYWDVARPFIMEYVEDGGGIDTKYALFAEAGRTNDLLWGSYPSRLNPSAEPRTTEEDIEVLRTFLRGHINWLDKRFQSVVTLIEAMNTYSPYPCGPEILVGIPEITSDNQTGVRKVIQDKHLYIIKDGETYTIDGKRIK